MALFTTDGRILLPSPSTTLVSNSWLPGLLQKPFNSSPCFSPGPSTSTPPLCPPQNFDSNPLQLEARSHCCSIQDSCGFPWIKTWNENHPYKVLYTLLMWNTLLWPRLPILSSLLTLLQLLFLQILSRLPSWASTLAWKALSSDTSWPSPFRPCSIIALH